VYYVSVKKVSKRQPCQPVVQQTARYWYARHCM